jgi:hypothetical protein
LPLPRAQSAEPTAPTYLAAPAGEFRTHLQFHFGVRALNFTPMGDPVFIAFLLTINHKTLTMNDLVPKCSLAVSRSPAVLRDEFVR